MAFTRTIVHGPFDIYIGAVNSFTPALAGRLPRKRLPERRAFGARDRLKNVWTNHILWMIPSA